MDLWEHLDADLKAAYISGDDSDITGARNRKDAYLRFKSKEITKTKAKYLLNKYPDHICAICKKWDGQVEKAEPVEA